MAEKMSDAQRAENEVSGKIRHAYKWTVVGSAVRYGATFCISIVLARLLKPADYGLLGMVTVFTELLSSVYDWSLGSAVIQLDEEDPVQERKAYFTIALILGIAFTAILFFAAPFIADFYRQPKLLPLTRAMSLVMIIGSIRTVSGSRITRQLRFRVLSVIDIASSLTAGIVAIVMAYLGFGVWALVANLILMWGIQAVAYGYYEPPALTWPIDRKVGSRIWKFTAPILGSGLLSKFYENADYLVVGKVLGAVSLGYYTLAFRLAMLINERISSSINRAAFPAFATLKDDTTKVREHWFSITRVVTLITFPLLVWLAVNAKDFLQVVLGPQWMPAATALRLLCIVTGVKILSNIVNALMTAVGHPYITFQYTVATAIVLPVAFWVGCTRAGLLGMGIAWCTVFPVMRLLFLFRVRPILEFSMASYGRNLWSSIWVSGVSALAMTPAYWLLSPGWQRLVLSTVLWAIAVCICFAADRDLRALVSKPLARLIPGLRSSAKEAELTA